MRTVFKDKVKPTYGEKMGVGYLQIVEIKVEHLLDSYIMT